ncbi:MAG: histidine kinase [Crocinitomicaceae bacterium]
MSRPGSIYFLLISIVLQCFFTFQVNGQSLPSQVEINSEHYSVFHWTSENGLPQNNVQQILEDENGQLWFSTFDGLAKFDGNSFLVYDESTSANLSSAFVTSMALDTSGSLWLTTNEEIICLKSSTSFKIPTKATPFKIKKINESIYFYSQAAIYKLEGTKCVRISLDFGDKSLENIISDSPWICQLNSTFYTLTDTSTSPIFQAERFYRLDENIYKAKIGPNYNLVELTTKGAFDFNGLPDKLKHLKPFEISKLLYSEDKKYTLIESLDSFFIFKNDTSYLQESKVSLGFHSMTTVYVDSEERIWLGSSYNGVHLFEPKTFTSVSQKNSSWEINGHMVYQAPDTSIYFEAGCGKIVKIDPNKKDTSEITVSTCPWTMLISSKGETWVNGSNISLNKHLAEYDPQSIIGNDLVYSMFEHKGTIYLGAINGIYFFDEEQIKKVESTDSIKKVYMFYENNEQELLFCSSSGIGVVKGQRAKVLLNKGNGLKSSDVRTIYQDVEDRYWIGYSKFGLATSDGLSLFHFPTRDGRINKNIWTIIEDDHGFLWLNSNQGIYRIKREDLVSFSVTGIDDFNSQRFSEKDGLHSAEGNSRTQNKGFKDHEGNIWFSMISGPAYVNPENLDVKNAHPIILDEVLIDGRNVRTRNILMKADDSQITFKFSHACFGSSDHISYLYRLEQQEEKWSSVGNSRYITFSELPPKEYVLTIKQAGQSNVIKIPFRVKAHFWNTDTFKHSLIVVTMSLIFFIGFRIWRKRRKRIAQIKKIDSELKNLELRALQSQMNPHFVFNCLSSISALYLSNDQKAANEYMSNFSTLLRIILEHAQKNMISLREEVKMFNIYVPLEALQFDEPFELVVDVDPLIDLDSTFIPSMVSHTFVENAIKHGLKPLKNRVGNLTIKVRKSGDMIIILIEDNGIGYENSQRIKSKMNSSHKSRGLENTNKRINLLNLLKDLNISVETVNLYDSSGTAAGTRVTLTFPIIDLNENANR